MSAPVSVSSLALLTSDALQDKPEARQAYLTAMRERREQVAALLLSDPETLAAVMGAMAERGVEDSSVAQQLRSLLEELAPGRGGSGEPKPKQE